VDLVTHIDKQNTAEHPETRSIFSQLHRKGRKTSGGPRRESTERHFSVEPNGSGATLAAITGALQGGEETAICRENA
jgi:hypothetical protein